MNFIKNISTSKTPDQELIADYKKTKDIKFLGELYQPYMELVFGVCLKYLKNTELAKDAVMQIFEELLEKILKYEIDNFKSWLYTLARNHCLMYLRTPRNLKTIEINPAVMKSLEEMHLDSVTDTEASLEKMQDCLKHLSPDQKESVELFYLENRCYKEISELTGKDLNKVRSLIQNGKRNLKICIEAKTEINI